MLFYANGETNELEYCLEIILEESLNFCIVRTNNKRIIIISGWIILKTYRSTNK